uniref:Dynein axonemal intermediate chain 4 n=1 Tax=Aureoumbra lagunensis TaxID=44058 RepID=A0A7S3NQ65_9STRA
MKETTRERRISDARSKGVLTTGKVGQNRVRTNNKIRTQNEGRVPRVVENGIDRTPLPLVLTDGISGLESTGREDTNVMVIPTPASRQEEIEDDSKKKKIGIPSNEELSAIEVTFEDELLDERGVIYSPHRQVVQYLTESNTETLLEISGCCVARDATDKSTVEASNEKYEQLLIEKVSSDRFIQRQAQTHNAAIKERAVATDPVQMNESGTQATNWDIFDSIKNLSNATTMNENDDSATLTVVEKEESLDNMYDEAIHKELAAALASPDFLLDVSEAKTISSSDKIAKNTISLNNLPQLPVPLPNISDAERVIIAQRAARILHSSSLAQSLARIERCVQQNNFHDKQLEYRGHTPANQISVHAEIILEQQKEDNRGIFSDTKNLFNLQTSQGGSIASSDEFPHGTNDVDSTTNSKNRSNIEENDTKSSVPQKNALGLEELWAWNAPITCGFTVTSMSWNESNNDILAVGYGGLSYAAPEAGLVLLWSLRNPEYPERKFMLSHGCTALHFSKRSPHLLAVGTRDGSVRIFDARRTNQEPLLESKKHTDPIWQVQWIDKGSERGEILVSISTDGRVLEWSVKKGLEDATLMILKRPGNAEGVISRQASGLCFDFPIDDPAIYIAGTEDGLAHRCSCSYNEQYLDTYTGHAGPIFKIKCSPFWSPVFLSCSADWTVKLWHQKHLDAIHSFHSLDLSQVVNDIAWSPFISTIFASVAHDGRIEIWDLKQSTLDPIIRHFTTCPESIPALSRPPPPEKGNDERPLTANTDDDLPLVPKQPDPAHLIPPSATTVLFATTAPVLVVGDAQGSVTCYRIKGVEDNASSMPKETSSCDDKQSQVANLKAVVFPEAKQ